MKKIYFFMAAVMVLLSCERLDTNLETKKDVMSEEDMEVITGNTDSLSVEDILKDKPNGTYYVNNTRYKKMTWKAEGMEMTSTRATLAEEGMLRLWVFDGTTLVKKQESTEDGFGSLSLVLTYGEHSLSFVADKGDGASYSAPYISWTKVKDTFGVLKPINIVAATRLEQSVSLQRLVSEITFTMTDAVPNDAQTLTATFGTWNDRLKVTDFSGGAAENKVKSVAITSLRGYKNGALTYRTFPTALNTEETISAKFVGTDASGNTLAEWSTEVLKIKSNNKTTISGDFWSKANASVFSLATEWGTGYSVDME